VRDSKPAYIRWLNLYRSANFDIAEEEEEEEEEDVISYYTDSPIW
jgi:hypothetical protein